MVSPACTLRHDGVPLAHRSAFCLAYLGLPEIDPADRDAVTACCKAMYAKTPYATVKPWQLSQAQIQEGKLLMHHGRRASLGLTPWSGNVSDPALRALEEPFLPPKP